MKKNWKKFWKLGEERFNTQFFNITKDGELTVLEGNYLYNINDLAKKYGTPLEVVFPFILEHRLNDLIGYFNAYMKINEYKGKFFYHYPMKVNQNKEFVLSLVAEGAHIEVASVNELTLVKQLWERDKFNTKLRVIANGPKTDAYLKLIDELRGKGLAIIPIVEDEWELDRLAKWKGDIGVRVNLNVKVASRWDKKVDRFGLDEKDVLALPKMKNLKILHYHIGSQMMTQKSVVDTIRRAMQIYVEMVKTNSSLDTLDVGGGFGIPYEKKKFYSAKSMANQIVKLVKMMADKAGVKHPNLVVEWGRYIAAPAQITVFKVISEKAIHVPASARAWYVLDGSFINDLSDTWAIHQKWHVIPANHMSGGDMKSVWLAGSSCDSDDKYTGGNYVLLPKLKEDKEQFVAVLDTGAYQDSLASHHCLLSSPLKLIAESGYVKVARRRETAEAIGRLFGWGNEDK